MSGSGAVLLLAAFVGGGFAGIARAAEPAPVALNPAGDRITDATIARDRATMENLGRRLAAVDSSGSPAYVYARAQALAWLEVARDQYALNDRSGLVDDAFERASNLAAMLETRGAKLRPEFQSGGATPRIREDLWQMADSVKRTEAFRCVAVDVARLEVTLVRAGHETTVCRAEDPHPHAMAAAAGAARVRSLAAECILRVAIAPAPEPKPPTPEAAPAAVPAAKEVVQTALRRLGAFSNVHFDLGAETISLASASVLDSVATVMSSVPEIRATLIGHTDPRGSIAYNLALGQRRASAVRDYLVRRGVNAVRLSIGSQGKTALVAVGTSAHEYALNRRVEIQYSAPIDTRISVRRQEGDLQIEKSRPKAKAAAPHRKLKGVRKRVAGAAKKSGATAVKTPAPR
jgi:outer membrane protein OmpA-like peptidoglycan-associated protein